MFENVTKIKFDGKYINGKAKELITNFERNTYIIKGSTGIGGTTALLNYTGGNCLIISPNVGMIKKKEEGKYDSDKQFFIYSETKKLWEDVEMHLKSETNSNININKKILSYIQNKKSGSETKCKDETEVLNTNLIINTTPEQIINLREQNNYLYNKLRTFNVFVDEFHLYTADAGYREAVGGFMELIFNEWIGKYKLSTATPNFNFIDIPHNEIIDIYKLERENQPKKPLLYSTNITDIYPFIYDEVNKGHKVVLFTNNTRLHKGFTDLKVHNLTGELMRIKLAPYERANNGIEIPPDTQLIICTSSYYAGFDIEFDCSIIILSEEKKTATKIHINNLIQCYGRPRQGIHKALFINSYVKPQKNTIKLEEVEASSDKAVVNIIKANVELINTETYSRFPIYINRANILAPALEKANDYILYNEAVMLSELSKNNFIVTPYDNTEIEKLIVQNSSVLFADRIKNLLKLDSTQLWYGYLTIKKNLTYKDNIKYTTALAFEYLTAWLLKISNSHLINTLDNKRVYANDLYKPMDLFLRVNHPTEFLTEQLTNEQQREAERLHKKDIYIEKLDRYWGRIKDWHYLYAVHKVKKRILPQDIKRHILIGELFNDVDIYNKNCKDKKNRVRNTKTHIINKIEAKGIDLSPKELYKLDVTIKKRFQQTNRGETLTNTSTEDHIVTKMVNALLFLWSDGKNEIIKEVKNREYHSITQLAGVYRSIIPIKWISVDLTSANPQIVDYILKSNVSQLVYQTLIDKNGVIRDKAKELYNSCLNNHYNTRSKAYKFYLECGYTDSQAKQLSELTAEVNKGAFYEVVTKAEKDLMSNYASILPFKSHRFHDAILLEYEDVVNYNVVLPTVVNDYIFHIDFFNDGGNYENITDEKMYSANGFVKNHRLF